MTTRPTPTDADYAALDSLAGGQPLSHRYRLTCTCPSTVAPVIGEAQAAGATVRSLTLNTYDDDQHEVRLCLCGIGSAEARELSRRFHDLSGVRSSQVEHQWTKGG